MLLFRHKLYSIRARIFAFLVVLVGVAGMTLFAVHQANAESQISFDFIKSGESPDSYGIDVADGEWQYVYEFTASSDESPISSIEFEIDSEGRQSLAEYSTSGDFDDLDESILFTLNQVPYADFNNHSITFYVTTTADEESSYMLPLEPYPDGSPPEFYFTDYTEGTVSSTMMPFAFEVYDDYVEDVTADIDGDFFDISPYESGYDYRYYSIDLSNTYFGSVDIFDGLEHTITFTANDPYGNEEQQAYSFTYDEEGGGGDYEEEFNLPVFDFDVWVEGVTGKPLEYEGTVDDESPIDLVQYDIDEGERHFVEIDEENSTDTHKVFSIEISDISDGEHTINFYATDTWGNSTQESYNVDVDSQNPDCTASWYNLPSPHYSKEITYADITCTDDRGIVSAAYEIYHVVQGVLQAYDDHHIDPQDSSFGGTTETFDLDIDLTSFDDIDGVILVQFKVWDEAGNESSDYDPLTIDATDNTAPVVNLDEVTPDPLTDHTPTITGSCKDLTDRETNTYISLLEYKVDAGSYQSITLPNGGAYNDSYTESFSVDLPELDDGEHTVTVRCTDGASHSTTASDTFEIIDPTDPEPGEFTYTENFENTSNQDIPASNNVIWGDGKLRLKEDITISRNLISNTNICPRYGDCRGLWRPWKDPQDSNIIWYSIGGRIYTYNKQTQSSTLFDYAATYGLPQMGGEVNGFALGMFNGKKYLWMSDIYQLYVINLTDGVGISTTTYTDVGSINLDFERGRFAAYLTTTAGSYSNVAYLELHDMMNMADDEFTHIPYNRFDSNAVVGLFLAPSQNAVFAGPYAQNRLFKFNDQNTPHNLNDDVVDYYESGDYNAVFNGMTLDPDGKLIFGTANNSNGQLFVVSNDGGTPFDTSDDTVTKLATPLQLGYRNVYGLEYIEGENGIGDQILINTESNIPVYLNFNNTYTNPYDDTFIEFDTQAGMRPGASWAIMDDYDTMYVVSKMQGFYRVELTRGWKDMGEAVAIPPRPPQQLVVDNFVAEATLGGPIAYAPGSESSFLSNLGRALVPQAYAAGEEGVHYYVSTDGGVTWTEVTLGQLQQLQQADYRLKFKIEMEEVDGATPVLSSYSLAYAGYPEESLPQTTTGLSVTPSMTSTTTGGSFSLTVSAVDVLGYPTPSYDGTVTLTLIDTSTGNPTTGLSVSSVNINDGTGSVSGVQITKTGSFKIQATDGTYIQQSSTITVTSGESLPSPYLGFSASSFKIKKGESVTLHWASSNLTSFVLNPGNNQLTASTGDFIVHPDQTTEYTITGTGPYGSASSSLTITVEGELSSGGGSSPTPSPSASSSPSPPVSPFDGSSPIPVPDETELTPPEDASFTMNVSGDQTIVRGQKVQISWEVPEADEVIIDYPELRRVSNIGSFEIFPNDTTVITITARKGEETVQKKITITVVDAPLQLQEFARNLQEKAPWTVPLLSAAVQGAKALPIIGIGVSAALQAGMIGLLALTVISQVGFLALFNGKTLFNVLSAAGILPAKNRKGFVHQPKNGEPVPFATITVFEGDQPRGAVFATLVSDMYGVYLEPFLPKGQYNLLAAHDGHSFPTKETRPIHLSFKDFYKGEVLAVTSAKDRPAVLIPMDGKSPSQLKKAWKYKLLLMVNQTLQSLQWAVYPLALLSVVALWLAPNLINALIVGVYGLILLPKLLKRFKRPTLKGRVVINDDRRAVANATVTLTTTDGSVVAVGKSDTNGQFELFAPKGEYVMNVIATNMIWNEVKAGTLSTIQVGSPKAKNLTVTMSTLTNPFGGFS
ncbi:carboxypeptidase regulatory-like domain-containing protein [Patescibacteria group bacterium]|nr:carboxypeptidase regulatory-like domain-containing protein [Patescibacteria group bacterium]